MNVVMCLRAFGAVACFVLIAPWSGLLAAEDPAAEELAKELAGKGWIVFAGHPAEIEAGRLIDNQADRGPFDLYLVRPDGSDLRNITNTPDYHEMGGVFSRDGKKLLYRKEKKETPVNHNQWGTLGALVIADADGSNPVVHGEEGDFPWASWGPDNERIACLYKNEGKIRFFDLATKRLLREIDSQGIFQQMLWSPDGKHVVGPASLAGRKWNVIAIDVETEKSTLLTRALNCTPDWFQGDSTRVVYSNRNPELFPGQYNDYGLTMLMWASVDGKTRKLIYGNANKHCYYGCTSPDDKYVLFADDPEDSIVAGEMRVVRLADTPIIPPALKTLKLLHPGSKEGPVFSLKLPGGAPLRGLEPHWTYAEVGGTQ